MFRGDPIRFQILGRNESALRELGFAEIHAPLGAPRFRAVVLKGT